MGKYLKLNKSGIAVNWPTVWDYMDDESSEGSVEIESVEALMDLTNESDQWHCPKYDGDKHVFVLNPTLIDAYRDFLKTPEQLDAEIYLNETDYVVMKLYEDSLGINKLSDESKERYMTIVAERQKRREIIRQAEAAIESRINAELSEDGLKLSDGTSAS